MKKAIRFYLLLAACVVALIPITEPLHGQAVTFLGSPVDFGNVSVCNAGQTNSSSCSKTLTLVYKVTAGGTLGKPRVLTGGLPFLAFSFSRSSCSGSVTAGTRCDVVVTFTPKTVGSLTGSVEIVDASGNVLATTLIYGAGLAPAGMSVTTQHNDNARDGLNAAETILTPQTVNAATFGKLRDLATDGTVHAQPLYVSNLWIAGQPHNVIVTATEHASVYAFDADNGAQLWRTTTLANETPGDSPNCYQIYPEIGITATPVIDRSYGLNGGVFVVAYTKDATGAHHQRLHALDLATGAELPGSPTEIQATFPGTGYGSSNGMQLFDPAQYEERVGLLLLNGEIYMAWASHCDLDPYTGWLMAYSESTLQQTGVLNLTPNGPSSPHFANGEGAVWMGGTGLSADSQGNIYFLDGNGTFDATFDGNGFPSKSDFGNSFLKVSVTGNTLAVADYFVHFNVQSENPVDEDLGSGGAILLPDLQDANGKVRQLAVGAGKDKTIFVVDRTDLGKFDPGSDNSVYQEVPNALSGGVFSAPAYFQNTLYYAASGDHLKSFPIQQALLATAPSAQSTATFKFPGATPSISANGNQNGIVWATENQSPGGVLHAYDATNVASELYNSNQAPGNRDNFVYSKYVTPTIANGKVFVGTASSVAVFGLLQ